ncbi:MAG TPA: MFS transporter, partial [Candidatus Obscuribacterales bacterium]
MSDTSPSDHLATTPEPDKLNLSTKLAYGAGDLGTAITANVLVFYLSFFLTNVAGMSPGLAGTVRMVAGIWDAINDPVVGVLSDRTRSRWGRRYPWMIFGAVPLGMFFFLHWFIPPFITDTATNQLGLFWYYIVISIFFNTAFTAVNLPYTALTPELTQDYNERTNLNSFRFAFSIGGSILSLVLAQIIFSTIKDETQQYLLLGGICAIACILPTYWCVWGTRQRVRTLQAQAEEDNSASLPYFQQLRIVFNNRPFLFVIGIYLFSWLGVQVTATIIPYFV